MKYGDLTLGQVEAMVNKLGGMDGVKRFLSGESVIKAVEHSFSIWKTITIGLHKNAESYRKALKSCGFKISDWVNDILKKIVVSSVETILDLVILTVAELGFNNGATLQQIYDRAKELGLELCPAEVGLALCLAYLDQPYGEWLQIAMEPITDSDGGVGVFHVAHDDDEQWLGMCWSSSDGVWNPDDQWVFVGPRK